MPGLRRLSVLLALLALPACKRGPETTQPAFPDNRRRPDIAEMLRAETLVEPNPRDGAGRAWIESQEPARLEAGGTGRFELIYEAGPLGIATGGRVLLQVSPFWDWSTPQTDVEDLDGYTTVSTEAEGVELEAETLDRQLLGIRIGGRELRAGERLRIVYGAGPTAARVDRFAERGTHLWIAVDGDGDGRRALLTDSPAVDVAPGPAAAIVAHLPSAASPGDTVELVVALLDVFGNAGVDFSGELAIEAPAGTEAPASVVLEESAHGMARVPVRLLEEGITTLVVRGPDGLAGATNPCVVAAGSPRILWGDLHGHSHFSDGTGIPEDYFRYARDVAALDVVALTDHDHWGLAPLATHPAQWEEIRRQVRAFHEPGRFVTLLGYEWTSWIWGHRHVLYFGDEGDVLDSVDPAWETPQQLWDGLRGKPALTFAHHSAGGPIATDWNIAPDPELEPVTEIVSVHGSSEAPDSPKPIYAPVAGNYVRDALDHGYRLGFVGSGDTHDGHPGLGHLASPSGGLAAILSEELTREGVREALVARRVYATNGPRIVLRVSLDGHRLGATVPPSENAHLHGIAVGETAIERIDFVQSGGRLHSLAGDGRSFLPFDEELGPCRDGEWVYVRAVQGDGGAAWSSPFFCGDDG